MSQRTVINKALGALHCTQNAHQAWFKAYPRGYLDKVFLRNWQELNHLAHAYTATFKELGLSGNPSSCLKRVELNNNQPFPSTM